MDRDRLLATLPANAVFNASPPYRRKLVAEDFIRAILQAISEEDRAPDAWEAQDVAAAIGYIAAGWYNAALAAGDRALTPVEERAPNQPIEAGDLPTLQQLGDALDYVSGMPARNY